MTPEAVNAYFTPLDYALYLMAVFAAMVAFYQYKWAKTCKTKTLVCVQKADGHGSFDLADQSGGSVTLINPATKATRLWPLNELATIEVPYPGVGFVPAFMQKSIRMILVSEGDWEPLTNRSIHHQKVASPDIVTALTHIKEHTKDTDVIRKLDWILDGVSTGPTREMIASPEFLGNIVMEKVSQVAITVVKDVLDPVTAVIKRLNKLVSPTMFFIGIGAVIAVQIFIAYQVVPMSEKMETLTGEMSLIKQSLGITAAPPAPPPTK